MPFPDEAADAAAVVPYRPWRPPDFARSRAGTGLIPPLTAAGFRLRPEPPNRSEVVPPFRDARGACELRLARSVPQEAR
ncbi:hypothetical protein [Streptomyces sp. NPDC051218]|uniref:hypothetical protein n=1 Tax=Streptomyces sp. NPDC051218 TaxID=3365645 RepID=UPI0037BABCD3